MRQGKGEWLILKLTLVFYHLHSVGPKPICALAHLGCTRKAGTSLYMTKNSLHPSPRLSGMISLMEDPTVKFLLEVQWGKLEALENEEKQGYITNNILTWCAVKERDEGRRKKENSFKFNTLYPLSTLSFACTHWSKKCLDYRTSVRMDATGA